MLSGKQVASATSSEREKSVTHTKPEKLLKSWYFRFALPWTVLFAAAQDLCSFHHDVHFVAAEGEYALTFLSLGGSDATD